MYINTNAELMTSHDDILDLGEKNNVQYSILYPRHTVYINVLQQENN